MLIGAPPCQGFSHAGFRSKGSKTGYRIVGDSRNFLFEHMVRLALDLKPRLFLMENVPGMHSARSEDLSFLNRAARLLKSHGGYRTAIWPERCVLRRTQDRIRCFLAASRDTLPPQPQGDYRDRLRPELDVDALPPVTLNEAIFDLPVRKAGEGTAVERVGRTASDSSRRRRYLQKFGLLPEISAHLQPLRPLPQRQGPRTLRLAPARRGQRSCHRTLQASRPDEIPSGCIR